MHTWTTSLRRIHTCLVNLPLSSIIGNVSSRFTSSNLYQWRSRGLVLLMLGGAGLPSEGQGARERERATNKAVINTGMGARQTVVPISVARVQEPMRATDWRSMQQTLHLPPDPRYKCHARKSCRYAHPAGCPASSKSADVNGTSCSELSADPLQAMALSPACPSTPWRCAGRVS